MYNTEVFKEAPTSWNVVFEEMDLPDGKSNDGRVQAYDGPIYVADAALYLMSHKPELGIKNPYELNEDQYKAALDLLREQRKLVSALLARRLHPDGRLHQRGRGRLRLVAVPGQHAAERDAPIASTIPEEGATGWADTTMMHAEAAHPNCAYMWMEHSLSPKVQGDLAAWFGSVPSVPAACKGNELLDRRGLRHQRLGQFRPDQVLDNPGLEVRQPGRMRALLPLGVRLRRGDRRRNADARDALSHLGD